MPEEIYIVSAVRTPIGDFNGCLASLKAHELGSIAIREALKKSKLQPSSVSEVIMGQVLTAGQGQNPARQSSIMAGLPEAVPAYLVNMLCGSGLKAVALAAQAIKCADSSVVIAGGQESMSKAPHCLHVRSGIKMGNGHLVDTMLFDGLTDAFHNYHMGVTAENVSKMFKVTREEQDEFALQSQLKAETAIKSEYFKQEIVPVLIAQKSKEFKQIFLDEHPQSGCTLESLQRLKTCFEKGNTGTVTAGNSSSINDGAAAVVLVNSIIAKQEDLTPLARIVSWAQTGVSPNIMGIGTASAVRKALEKAGWSTADVDLYELNEAFAAQSVAVIRELGINSEKVNIQGGAIALGHPIGASGARILVTLIHSLHRTGGKKGVAAACVGGGMGIAMCIEIC